MRDNCSQLSEFHQTRSSQKVGFAWPEFENTYWRNIRRKPDGK